MAEHEQENFRLENKELKRQLRQAQEELRDVRRRLLSRIDELEAEVRTLSGKHGD